jgi:hypothetical protein
LSSGVGSRESRKIRLTNPTHEELRRLLPRREKLVSDYKAVENMPESEIIE